MIEERCDLNMIINVIGSIEMAHLYKNNPIRQSLLILAKKELVWKILHFKGRFPFDFTRNYLSDLPVNKLRHILYAANSINC